MLNASLAGVGFTLQELSESAVSSETCGELIKTSFLISITGDPSLISPEGLTTFANGVVTCANEHLFSEARGCDPFKRAIVSASAELVTIDALPQSVGGRRSLATVRRFYIKVTVNYQCKNCKTGAALLKNDAVKRRRLESESQLVQHQRRLVTIATSADNCTCPDDSPEFIEPTRPEFDVEFNKTVDALIATSTTGILTL